MKEFWDNRYREPGFAYGKQANDFLAANLDQLPASGRILCLAEGEGRNAVYLAEKGYRVTAVDQSEIGLHKATDLAQQHGVNIHTHKADLADYQMGDACWDGIVSISAHVPLIIRQKIHQPVITALIPGRIFLLEAYTLHHTRLDGIGGPPAEQSDMFMSLSTLRDELQGLDFMLGQEIERQIHEGRYHHGKSGVVQLIARKPS